MKARDLKVGKSYAYRERKRNGSTYRADLIHKMDSYTAHVRLDLGFKEVVDDVPYNQIISTWEDYQRELREAVDEG